MLDAPLAQLGTHDAGQRADGRFIDIGHFQRGGVDLVARAHAADDGRTGGIGLHDHGQLTSDGIDGIHHVIVLGKIELVLGVRRVESLVDVDHGIGVDLQNAVTGDLDLVLAHGFAGRQNLAVDVGQADLIVIDEVQRTDAAAGQGFDRIAADTADAEHGHPGFVQFFHGLVAKQQFRSRKLIEHSVPLTPKALNY